MGPRACLVVTTLALACRPTPPPARPAEPVATAIRLPPYRPPGCGGETCSATQICVSKQIDVTVGPVTRETPCPKGTAQVTCPDESEGCCAEAIATVDMHSYHCREVAYTCDRHRSCECLQSDPCDPGTRCGSIDDYALYCHRVPLPG